MKPGFEFDRAHPEWPDGFHYWHYGPFHGVDLPWWVTVPLLLATIAAYFIPTLLAYRRGHHNRAAIALLNLFLGWTFFGWVAALVWAATAVKSSGPGGAP